MNPNRLSKVLAAAGVASRRESERPIFDGKVRVNGIVTLVPQTIVDPEKATIYVNDAHIQCSDKKVYYLLNKPKGYICSNKRIGSKKLVIDLFKDLEFPCRLFTIGRLDRDTTGLLLVTNDGHFAQKVIHPSNNLSKEYLVKTSEEISDQHLKDLSKGTLIEGKWIRPFSIKKMRKGTLKMVVKEGKKREVRLMVQNVGLTLLSLTRIRIGNLRLGPIPEGYWKPLSLKEASIIFS